MEFTLNEAEVDMVVAALVVSSEEGASWHWASTSAQRTEMKALAIRVYKDSRKQLDIPVRPFVTPTSGPGWNWSRN